MLEGIDDIKGDVVRTVAKLCAAAARKLGIIRAEVAVTLSMSVTHK